MICPNCKKEINNEAIFCPYCGFNLSNNNIIKNGSLKNSDSNNKKIILSILVVVVFIGGIVFGISVFMNKKNENNTIPTNNQVENNNENDNSDEHENDTDNDEGFLMEIFSVKELNDEEISLEGNVVGGVVRKNDKLEIAGHGSETKTVKVKRILIDGEEVAKSNGNVSTAIVVSSSIKDDISTEQILFNPKFYSVVNNFDADITLYTKEDGGRTTPVLGTYTPRIAFYSYSIISTINIPSSIDMVIPGESANLHVTLDDNMVMRVGSKFKITEGMKNVGVGTVTKIYSN